MKKISLILFIFLLSCNKVLLTGRRQFNVVSNKILFPSSFASYDKVISSSKSGNAKSSKQIKLVGARLQKALEEYLAQNRASSKLEGYKWEYHLIEDEQINAWCMPGGKVAFFSGILPICENETGIAVVMSHEISHAFANHSAERMSQMGLVQIGSILGKELNLGKAFEQIYSPVAGVVVLKYSRNHESEADKIGLYLMAMAGYDPREAINFWKRMAKANENRKKIPEFLSTHPHSETRIKLLEKEMPKALEYYYKAQEIN